MVTLTSGKSFHSKAGVSILDAAAIEKIAIPYSCKTGRCSACKCKVISGSTRALEMEVGLNEDERAAGWILSCVRTAESDSVLEVDDLGGIDLPVAKILPSRISKIEYLTVDVIRVFLRLPPNSDFHFIPGQYIDVIGPKGIRRSYSLANADLVNKLLELHIRAVPDGVMSDYWFNRAGKNDLLHIYGPLGTFFLREISGIDLVFLATGTGIAPIKAMLESLIDLPIDNLPSKVTVIWGGRYLKDLYFDEINVKIQHAYIPVLSRPPAGWIGSKGYVQNVLLATNNNLSNTSVYACGSEKMIKSAKADLIQSGLPISRIYSDAFLSSGFV